MGPVLLLVKVLLQLGLNFADDRVVDLLHLLFGAHLVLVVGAEYRAVGADVGLVVQAVVFAGLVVFLAILFGVFEKFHYVLVQRQTFHVFDVFVCKLVPRTLEGEGICELLGNALLTIGVAALYEHARFMFIFGELEVAYVTFGNFHSDFIFDLV